MTVPLQFRPSAGLTHSVVRPGSYQSVRGEIADLVPELTDPAIEDLDGKRRATAIAKLSYVPADSVRRIESQRYRFAAPSAASKPRRSPGISSDTSTGPPDSSKCVRNKRLMLFRSGGRLLYDCLTIHLAREVLEACGWRERLTKNSLAGNEALL